MNKHKSLAEEREENLMFWVSFWRKNPHRFAADYLGINLHLFQKILIFMIERVPFFMYIASRGQGKSWLTAVYCVVRCILYPGTRIIIASGTKGQSRLIISEKIVALYNNSFALRQEIGDYRNIKQGTNQAEVHFLNGSKISAETSSDNARGFRAHILICDEFRLIKKSMLVDVLKPFLNVPRQPEFLGRPEYANYPREPNKEVYLSSAWYKSHWIWDEFQRYIKGMMSGRPFVCLAIPYQLSVFHQLLPIERVEADREADDFDAASFAMEYDANFIGENDRGYFKLDDINKCRTISRAFYPPTHEEYLENKNRSKPKQLSNMPRTHSDSEIRFVSVDIALLGGNVNVKNDSSVLLCVRLIQEGETYRRDVVYQESILKSIDSYDLAVRVKQLYKDFQADYIVMDANGNGLGVFDAGCRIMYDEDRDEEYEPWSSINDNVINERFKTKGLPIVYSVKATAEFNHICAVGLRSALEKGRIRFLMNDIMKREEFLVDKAMEFKSKSLQEQQRLMYPYQQATAMANELVALEYKVHSGYIRIEEVGSATKDRYSALSYVNQRAMEFEALLKEEKVEMDFEDFIFFTNNRRGGRK